MGQFKERQSRIAELNDALRCNGEGGEIFVTRSLHAMGPAFVARALALVRALDRFEPDNDPYCEHDFGVVRVEGDTVYFKIDYYDREKAGASPDPSNPSVTTRVMTLMLADDY